MSKQNSSGGKEKLGSITKRGDRYLRSLFTAGALAVIRYAKIHRINHRPWLTALLARRPTKVAAIALANKIARMAWAMMSKGERLPNSERRSFSISSLKGAITASRLERSAAAFAWTVAAFSCAKAATASPLLSSHPAPYRAGDQRERRRRRQRGSI